MEAKKCEKTFPVWTVHTLTPFFRAHFKYLTARCGRYHSELVLPLPNRMFTALGVAVGEGGGGGGLLVALRPSSMLVYLKYGSVQAILRATTLK